MELVKNIIFHNPAKVVFGCKSFARFIDDFGKTTYKKLFVLSISEIKTQVEVELEKLRLLNVDILINYEIKGEPSFAEELTVGVPPKVTAATGIDALTHCIEAYVNRFSHPITDLLALEGIELIYESIVNECKGKIQRCNCANG